MSNAATKKDPWIDYTTESIKRLICMIKFFVKRDSESWLIYRLRLKRNVNLLYATDNIGADSDEVN